MNDPLLTPIQARIIGVLTEKQRTVPDTYPLSLSALTAGCNQKTARDPVLSLSETQVLEAIDELRRDSWVLETSGSRVMRYEQNAQRVLQIPSNSLPLLAVLMLRGPQTAAELRANVDRWHHFADTSSVEAYLDELAARPTGALVVRLTRAPGARESRWTHLLCGLAAHLVVDPNRHTGSAVTRVADDESVSSSTATHAGGASEYRAQSDAASRPPPAGNTSRDDAARLAELQGRVDMLEYELGERLTQLEAEVAALKAQRGQ